LRIATLDRRTLPGLTVLVGLLLALIHRALLLRLLGIASIYGSHVGVGWIGTLIQILNLDLILGLL
jgi:hypothetical protein